MEGHFAYGKVGSDNIHRVANAKRNSIIPYIAMTMAIIATDSDRNDITSAVKSIQCSFHQVARLWD